MRGFDLPIKSRGWRATLYISLTEVKMKVTTTISNCLKTFINFWTLNFSSNFWSLGWPWSLWFLPKNFVRERIYPSFKWSNSPMICVPCLEALKTEPVILLKNVLTRVEKAMELALMVMECAAFVMSIEHSIIFNSFNHIFNFSHHGMWHNNFREHHLF